MRHGKNDDEIVPLPLTNVGRETEIDICSVESLAAVQVRALRQKLVGGIISQGGIKKGLLLGRMECLRKGQRCRTT